MIDKKGTLVTKEEIFTSIWITEYIGDLNTLYTNTSFIRGVIEPNPSNPCYLITVRGNGYKLDGAGEASGSPESAAAEGMHIL